MTPFYSMYPSPPRATLHSSMAVAHFSAGKISSLIAGGGGEDERDPDERTIEDMQLAKLGDVEWRELAAALNHTRSRVIGRDCETLAKVRDGANGAVGVCDVEDWRKQFDTLIWFPEQVGFGLYRYRSAVTTSAKAHGAEEDVARMRLDSYQAMY